MTKGMVVYLKRPAKKAGGDRYEAEDEYVIYIPQEISRPNNTPVPEIEITFDTKS